MPLRDSQRRDPFAETSQEPLDEIQRLPAVLARSANARKSRVHPSEKNRRARTMTITFSDSAVPDRLRQLAHELGLITAAGQPNVSALIEPWVVEKLGKGSK